MIAKLLFILSLFISFQAESQNVDDTEIVENHSIADQLYTKCFENLNQGKEIFDKYPDFKEDRFCKLYECMFLFYLKEPEMKFAAEKRLIEIATRLYQEGTPVYLTMGMDSYLNAENKNKNLEDDNHIVYISYGDCINPSYLIDAAEIVNRQTHSLINESVSK